LNLTFDVLVGVSTSISAKYEVSRKTVLKFDLHSTDSCIWASGESNFTLVASDWHIFIRLSSLLDFSCMASSCTPPIPPPPRHTTYLLFYFASSDCKCVGRTRLSLFLFLSSHIPLQKQSHLFSPHQRQSQQKFEFEQMNNFYNHHPTFVSQLLSDDSIQRSTTFTFCMAVVQSHLCAVSRHFIYLFIVILIRDRTGSKTYFNI
jgi:hypothetical protein